MGALWRLSIVVGCMMLCTSPGVVECLDRVLPHARAGSPALGTSRQLSAWLPRERPGSNVPKKSITAHNLRRSCSANASPLKMSSVQKPPLKPLTTTQNIMAGAFAGMAEICCMYVSSSWLLCSSKWIKIFVSRFSI